MTDKTTDNIDCDPQIQINKNKTITLVFPSQEALDAWAAWYDNAGEQEYAESVEYI